MLKNTNPELVFFDRKGVPMKFNPLSSDDDSKKNESILVPFVEGIQLDTLKK